MRSALLLLTLLVVSVSPVPSRAQTPAAETAGTGTVLLSPDQVSKLLPPAVFFKGQSAPLQLRNAGAARFADGAVVFASLVDTSGYSTNVRERYQFYLVTEVPLRIGDRDLPAGAYGAGFLEDGTFVVMDVGGHDVLLGRTERDSTLRRPRPLQLEAGTTPQELRLYLGRSYAKLIRAAH